jgi:hypothetical protein
MHFEPLQTGHRTWVVVSDPPSTIPQGICVESLEEAQEFCDLLEKKYATIKS